MRIFVFTSDKYIQALRPFAWLFNKYWGPDQEVVVAGFARPDFELPDNFLFVSIGHQEDYPFHRWSNAVGKFLVSIPDEFPIIALEDYWLTKGVDREAVKMAYHYCAQFRYVARFDLTADRANAGGARFYANIQRPSNSSILRIVQSDPEEPYHMSLMCGVWNKGHLLRVMRPGESPHDLELWGTPRLRSLRNELLVLGYEREWQPVRYTLALRNFSGPGQLLLDELLPEDREELRRLGYLEPWGIK